MQDAAAGVRRRRGRRRPAGRDRRALCGHGPTVAQPADVETLRGSPPVNLARPGLRSGAEMAIAPGGVERYDPTSKTVYRFSSCGHDLTPGATRGTYVYHLPAQQTLLRDDGVLDIRPAPGDNEPVPALSLTVTAGRARDLRDARAGIDLFSIFVPQPRSPIMLSLTATPPLSMLVSTRAQSAFRCAVYPRSD